MIAIGGSIGTGLFVGSGYALATGGPASLVLSFILTGIMLYCTVHALGEMAVLFPVAGSFIVDPSDPTKPVLRGAVGEFVVSGKLVAQGYIGRPDLTKEKFITLNGQRCYRTGDLVRILHNNTFDFVGRADDQVKLRGQRLEIGEINSVIKKRTDEKLVLWLVWHLCGR